MAAKAPFRFWSFFFSTQGRVSRVPFAAFEVSLALLIVALMGLVMVFSGRPIYDRLGFLVASTTLLLVYTLTMWSRFAVMVKRSHDFGWPWFVALPMLLPLVMAGLQAALLTSRNLSAPPTPQWLATALSTTDIILMVVYHLLIVALCFVPGHTRTNRYGHDPRNPQAVSEVF